MVKCGACTAGVCQRSYENRHKCGDPENCTCTCQESSEATCLKTIGSFALGAAAFTGGIFLTVSTGGLGAIGIAAVVGGGALTGVGATAVIQPVAKQLSGERMTAGEYAKDLAISGTIGAITGPIGLGGASATTSLASKVGTEGVKQGAVKLGCRAAVGAVSGATAGVIQESVNAVTGENAGFSVTNVVKSAALGAVTGGASHVTGNYVNQFDPGIARSMAKVASDTVSTVAIDASYQLIVDGEVDGKKLVLNAGARAATSAGYEAVSAVYFEMHGGKEVLRENLDDKQILENLSPEDQEAVRKAKEYLEKLKPEEVEKQTRKAVHASDPGAKRELHRLENKVDEVKNNIKDIDNQIQRTKAAASSQLSTQEIATIRELLEAKMKLNNQKSELNARLSSHKRDVLSRRPDLMGDQNVHALENKPNQRNHMGQFAADLPDDRHEGRGLRRALFDMKVNRDGSLRYKISSIINEHDYNNAPRHGEVPIPDLTLIEPFILPKEELDDDTDDEKKTK